MVIRRTKTQNIKEVVDEFLKEYQLDKPLKNRQIERTWHEITGPMISKATQSVFVKDKKLFIKVRSSVIRSELSMIKEGLIERINRDLGEKLIEEIIFG